MPDVAGLSVLFPEGGLSRVRHFDPFGVGRGAGNVTVVPVPPLVRPVLGVALRRVLPLLLTPERRHVEVAPNGAHPLVAAPAHEVRAEHTFALACEPVLALPSL